MIFAIAWPFSVHAWTEGSQQRYPGVDRSTLLAKSIQSSRSRSVVNLVLGNEEVSTARKDELLTHPCVGRVEVAFDGTLPFAETGRISRSQIGYIGWL